MAWWEYVSGQVFVNSWLYHRVFPDRPAPVRPTDVQLPRVDEGAPMPLLYGKCRVRSISRVWFGNYLAPGDVYTRGGLSDATADHYSIDMLFVVGIVFLGGKGTLISAWAGDTPYAGSVEASAGTTQGYKFGTLTGPLTSFATSDKLINGVFYQGTAIQDVTNGTPADSGFPAGPFTDGVTYGGTTSYGNALLQSGLTLPLDLIPGYRHQVMLYGHFALGLTPEVPAVSLEIDARDDVVIGNSLTNDANPAAVLYDVLTSDWGKAALGSANVDTASFIAGALVHAAEGDGYSRPFEQGTDAMSIVDDILRHVDGMIYQEPTTGALVYKLVRFDYVVADLDDINPDNAEPAGPGWYSIQGIAETMNQVKVKFTDRSASYGDGFMFGQNMANIVAQGNKPRTVELSFLGCCDALNAQQKASRELAVRSRPMVKAQVKMNRTGSSWRPGDVKTLTWPELGIDHMVMRIVHVNRGQLHAGELTIDLIRDVFDTTVGAFPPP